MAERDPGEREDIAAEQDPRERATDHLRLSYHRINAWIDAKRSGRQREIELEGAADAYRYQVGKLAKLSPEELATLNLDQLDGYLWGMTKKRTTDAVRRRNRFAPEVPTSAFEDDEGRPVDDWLLRSAIDVNPQAWHESTVLLATVRLLELMPRRTHRPRLNEEQAMVVRFYLGREVGAPTMTDADGDLMFSFPDNGLRWKLNLAEHLAKKPSYVSDIIATKVLPAARAAIYLFVMLAPPEHPVLKQSQMGRLLDLVFAANPRLTTEARKLLENAPLHLVLDDGDFLIDVDALAANPGPGGARKPNYILHQLHDAEARYATNVDDQTDNPPRFRCVARCELHRPLEETLT